jgi:hypothetical protein
MKARAAEHKGEDIFRGAFQRGPHDATTPAVGRDRHDSARTGCDAHARTQAPRAHRGRRCGAASSTFAFCQSAPRRCGAAGSPQAVSAQSPSPPYLRWTWHRYSGTTACNLRKFARCRAVCARPAPPSRYVRIAAQAWRGRATLQSASAGNRTRVTSMATMYSTTRPLMLWQNCPRNRPARF